MGRHIHRDDHGRKVSESHLDRIVIGSVVPSFHPPLACAVASIDSQWRTVAWLGGSVVGPAVLPPDLAEALVDAWPQHDAVAGYGWMTYDEIGFDLALSSLDAEMAIDDSGDAVAHAGAHSPTGVEARLGEVLTILARESGSTELGVWLAATSGAFVATPVGSLR